jgi:hypothetical protein
VHQLGGCSATRIRRIGTGPHDNIADMATSHATTPEAYLDELPEDRREVIEAVRATILEHLPDGFTESMTYGMLSYAVPLEVFPDTYNGQPLVTISLANQKRHVAVYLMGVYGDDAERDRFVDAWKATGKKLDMGKSCVRFTRLDQVPLEVLGDAVARVTPQDLIDAHQAAHGRS